VIAASLVEFQKSAPRLYLSNDASDLVLEAAAALPDRVFIIPGDERVFCDEELAKPGEPVGVRVNVSVTPWRDPSETDSSTARRAQVTDQALLDTIVRDSTLSTDSLAEGEGFPLGDVRIAVWETPASSSAIYLNGDRAFVSVSGGCLSSSGGGGAEFKLVDGRVGTGAFWQMRFALQRDTSGWVVVFRRNQLVV
jgi:hypothetical protein